MAQKEQFIDNFLGEKNVILYKNDIFQIIVNISENTSGFFAVIYSEQSRATGILPGGFIKRGGPMRTEEILISRDIDRALRPIFNDFRKKYNLNIYFLKSSQNVSRDTKLSSIFKAVNYILKFHNLIDSDIEFFQLFNGDKQSLNRGNIVTYKNHIIGFNLQSSGIFFKDLLKKIKDILKYNNLKNKFEYLGLKINLKDKKYRFVDVLIKYAFYARDYSFIKNLLNKYDGIDKYFSYVYSNEYTNTMLRLDGRNKEDIREYSVEKNFLESDTILNAMIKKGSTVALVTMKNYPLKESQILDNIDYEEKFERFLVYYYFSLISNEVISNKVSRREIGHGELIKSALRSSIPELDEALNINVEILNGGGSTSQLGITGGNFLLYCSGLTDKKIAGSGLGAIINKNQVDILSDISEIDDFLGICDFKISSDENKNIYSIQLDVKDIYCIHFDRLESFLSRAVHDNIKIINRIYKDADYCSMNINIKKPIYFVTDQSKNIGRLIGKGGENIREITAKFKCSIDVIDLKLKVQCQESDIELLTQELKKYYFNRIN